MDVVFVSLLIQEVEHVLDSQGKRTATVSSAEDGLKEVIHKFLESALLREGRKEEHEVLSGKTMLNFSTPLRTEYVYGSGPESAIEKWEPSHICKILHELEISLLSRGGIPCPISGIQ